MTLRLTAAALLCLVLACGCVERTNAPLPVDEKLAAQATQWEEAESFGGAAELVIDHEDPFARRFDAGTFRLVSGLDVTNDEVWVTDMGISRLQVFDHSGRYLRSYGLGCPLRETLIADRELYLGTEGPGRDYRFWEQTVEGARWIGNERNLFQAADVLVQDGGYIIADNARTGVYSNSAARLPGIVSVPFDETRSVTRFEGVNEGWPSYIAGDGRYFAATSSLLNMAWLFEPGRQEGTTMRPLGDRAAWTDVLSAMYDNPDSPLYLQLLERAGKASGAPGKLNNPGGVAVAFEKAILCDTGNRRLQIFEVRTADDFFWGKLLRMIEATKTDGQPRFVEPRDVDVAPDGHVYVLDQARQELVELSPTFDRLGVVAGGYGNAYALDISPDGNHIYVTDRADNRVHHYVRAQ